MKSEEKTAITLSFSYSHQYKVFQWFGSFVVGFVFGLFLVVLGVLLAEIISFETEQFLKSQNSYWLAGVLLGIVLTFPVFLTSEMKFPALEIQDTRFRIRSALFKSKWLEFSDIKDVRRPFRARLRKRNTYAVLHDELGWSYRVIGATYWIWGKAFFITEGIDDFDKLVGLFKQQRSNFAD